MAAVTNVTREYLETIYNLAVEGDPIIGARLAEKFGVSAPNVADVLRRMERDGLIRMPGRGRGRQGEGIELTDEGRMEAEHLLRQHRLAERFLVDILGMDWVQAHEEAHNLERSMSPAIEQRFLTLLGNPRTCPHGNPIPDGTVNAVDYLRSQGAFRLSTAELGEAVRVLLISEVVEDESALLTYLGAIEVRPGATITVLARNALHGTSEVKVVPRGTRRAETESEQAGSSPLTVSLTGELAAKIWVKRGQRPGL